MQVHLNKEAVCVYLICVFLSQESVTDYTAPSSSLADSVPTVGNKMEESLVANVSTHYAGLKPHTPFFFI